MSINSLCYYSLSHSWINSDDGTPETPPNISQIVSERSHLINTLAPPLISLSTAASFCCVEPDVINKYKQERQAAQHAFQSQRSERPFLISAINKVGSSSSAKGKIPYLGHIPPTLSNLCGAEFKWVSSPRSQLPQPRMLSTPLRKSLEAIPLPYMDSRDGTYFEWSANDNGWIDETPNQQETKARDLNFSKEMSELRMRQYYAKRIEEQMAADSSRDINSSGWTHHTPQPEEFMFHNRLRSEEIKKKKEPPVIPNTFTFTYKDIDEPKT